MALISVVELLYDPDFVDEILVLRQVESVGQDGLGLVVEHQYSAVASVQAASGDDTVITAEAARTQSTYECITAFPLLAPSDATTNADIVIWRNMRFRVTSVAVFANFAGGAGHYEAMMEMLPVRVATGGIPL